MLTYPKPILLLWVLALPGLACAQEKSWSRRMAESFLTWHRDSIVIGSRPNGRWHYEQGLILKALEKVWYRTGDPVYFSYIKKEMDRYTRQDGTIRSYNYQDFNLDNIPSGRPLLLLSQLQIPGPDKDRYIRCAKTLWKQLQNQPVTKEGGYWHKKIYPNQMWLDGVFMAEPFAAEFSRLFNHPEHFAKIARQFDLVEKYAADPVTGLIYHAYDESREQQWADKTTGRSPHFWGRAVGWYAMALVDVLDYFPAGHPDRNRLIGYLRRLAPALEKYQDKKSGLWYQILDLASREGNYPEASASCMFVYALAKGVRMGYLPASYQSVAGKGYTGILNTFISQEPDGSLSLTGTVSVGGLGGNPYRDGSYAYYLSEPLRKNDLKGTGAFIFASLEMETAAESAAGKGKTVGLDYHFNREFRKDRDGNPEQYHYTWEDKMHPGFYWWGRIFRDLGATTRSVPRAPGAESLKGLDVYIIVDPDTPRETEKPNYIGPQDIRAIEAWVKAGGTLILMANDTANCETHHFNALAKVFGVQFSPKNRNMVAGKQYGQGKLEIPAGNPVFRNTRTIFIKELSVLQVNRPAKPLLTDQGDVIMSVTPYGKGKVFAVGDPWLYNEYVDGRLLGNSYENFQAAKELAAWSLQQK